MFRGQMKEQTLQQVYDGQKSKKQKKLATGP